MDLTSLGAMALVSEKQLGVVGQGGDSGFRESSPLWVRK